MCGIGGILNFGKTVPVDPGVLKAMNESMVHRGPDGDGIFINNSKLVGLCHRRLSIIDLSEDASQPMSNREGDLWISFNGEIYNHKTLRKELESIGAIFKSDHSDTEVLILGYQFWGLKKLLKRIDGMFAFAIWDEKSSRLVLARDRIGIKPVYFSKRNGVFVFASEIKALLSHPNIPARLGQIALYHYLTYLTTPAPLTMFDGIYKIPAAHYLEINLNGKLKFSRYWSPSPGHGIDTGGLSKLNKDEKSIYYQQEVLKRIENAVSKRMMSDVPFGAFLSGGIDSSLNVALMSQYSSHPVNTFTVGFKDHKHLNELEYAAKVAKEFNSNHHEILIDEKDMLSYLEGLVVEQDEPLADWVCIPLHFVSDLARRNGIKVVQVGEGSDEQFCGYHSYLKYLELERRYYRPFQKLLPKSIQSFVAHSALRFANWNSSFDIYADAIMRACSGQEPFWSGAIGFWETQKDKALPNFSASGPEGWEEMVASGILPLGYLETNSHEIAQDFLIDFDLSNPGKDQLTRMTYNEFRLRLPELLLMRVDKISMACGIEARVPFLDQFLVELTMDISQEEKISQGQAKLLLKSATKGLIPNEIINRKKMGFSAPMSEWLQGEFGNNAEHEILTSELIDEIGFDREYLSTMISSHRSGKRNNSLLIWVLYNLVAWHKTWI